MHPGRVILLEFNELSPRLMERFISEGKLPSFECFYGESRVFTTESDANAPNLEPWIQWITVHTGMPYREHKVSNLGDAAMAAISVIGSKNAYLGYRAKHDRPYSRRSAFSRRCNAGRECAPPPRACGVTRRPLNGSSTRSSMSSVTPAMVEPYCA